MVRQILLAATVGIAFTVAGCEEASPPAFNPRMFQQAERSDIAQQPTEDLRPLPTTRETAIPTTRGDEQRAPTTGPDLGEEPVVRLSLREIIHRAVINNHDVKVSGYQPAIEGTRVIEAQANFDPAFVAAAQFQDTDQLNGGVFFNNFTTGASVLSDVTRSQVGTAQVGMQQNLESGGQVSLTYENIYNYFTPATTLSNPFYESNLNLQLTQPLLKNFGSQVNDAQIVINRLNQKVSLLEFRKTVETTAANIEQTYWQLVETEQDIRIQEQLIGSTGDTYKILYSRMRENLDVSDLQVSQAQADLETRRALLVQYKAKARDLSDQLKALMSDPEYPVSSAILILPADEPVTDPMNFDLQDELNTAMENRFELGEQQLKVDSATVTVGVAKNNLLPELDFIGSVGPGGVAGNEGDAVTDNFNFQHIDFTAGLKITIPLGNRAARAVWRRALLQRMQAIEQYRSEVEQVSVDVKTSARAVKTSWDLIVEDRRARYDAEATIHSILQRERAHEPLTPEFVQLKLDRQQALAAALQSEANAVSSYNIALAQLERSKGTLLRYNNVVLQEQNEDATESALLH